MKPCIYPTERDINLIVMGNGDLSGAFVQNKSTRQCLAFNLQPIERAFYHCATQKS